MGPDTPAIDRITLGITSGALGLALADGLRLALGLRLEDGDIDGDPGSAHARTISSTIAATQPSLMS